MTTSGGSYEKLMLVVKVRFSQFRGKVQWQTHGASGSNIHQDQSSLQRIWLDVPCTSWYVLLIEVARLLHTDPMG